MTKRLRLSTNIQEIVQINPSSVTCMTLPPPISPPPPQEKCANLSKKFCSQCKCDCAYTVESIQEQVTGSGSIKITSEEQKLLKRTNKMKLNEYMQ